MSQEQNIEVAQSFLASLGRGDAPESVAALFTEDVEWHIAGDVGVLPWIGHKTGRAAVIDFIRDSGEMLERLKFDVVDITASDTRAIILGELASKMKSNGKVIETTFAVVLTISEGKITRFHMLEDSFAVSRAARAS